MSENRPAWLSVIEELSKEANALPKAEREEILATTPDVVLAVAAQAILKLRERAHREWTYAERLRGENDRLRAQAMDEALRDASRQAPRDPGRRGAGRPADDHAARQVRGPGDGWRMRMPTS